MNNQSNRQPVGQGAQAAHAIGKRPVSKKLLATVICCVVLAAAIIGTVIFATASTPEKAVEKYMNAIVDNDMAAAYECSVFDYKAYYTDYYSRENLQRLIDDEHSYYNLYNSVDEIYKSLQESMPDYDGTVASGEDVYNAFVDNMNTELKATGYKSFEIVGDAEKVDKGKMDLDTYNFGAFDDDGSDLDFTKYYDAAKISSVSMVNVKYETNDGESKATVYVVKVGGKWQILNGLY